jgi:hypothetical protein
LGALTHRAFELLLEQARAAEAREDTALASLSWWWDRMIDQRDQRVLPSGGGPPVTSTQTLAVQSQLHQSLQRLPQREQRDGSIRNDITTRDVVLFGAMLVTPLPSAEDWNRTARRHKEIYLDGLSPPVTQRPGLTL